MKTRHNLQQPLVLGDRITWGGSQPFSLTVSDRRHHLFIVGKTGTGKTTLLKNLILQDIDAGRGVALLDPHGDLAEELLDLIPSWRADDLVYFDPADQAFPVGLNLLKSVSPERRHLAAAATVSAFKSIWRESWGPRLEYVLLSAILALLECENVSLLGIPRMLVDEEYRRWVLRQCTDPAVRSFWLSEFEGYDKRFRSEIIAPLQNKVGQLLLSRPLRNVLGQVRSRIDARYMMDRGRIFIANLSKGKLGAEPASLLGALLVAQFQLAAMTRADTPESERRDFHLYLDEFASFSTDSFASIFSEARKYHLSLTCVTQYLEQIRPEIRQAVFGNVGSIITFRLGEADAAAMAREFGNHLTPGHFSGLENFQVQARVLTSGNHTTPFLGNSRQLAFRRYGRGKQLRRNSRQRYAVPQPVIEEKIRRWMGEYSRRS